MKCPGKDANGVQCERGMGHEDGRPFARNVHLSLEAKTCWIAAWPGEAQTEAQPKTAEAK